MWLWQNRLGVGVGGWVVSHPYDSPHSLPPRPGEKKRRKKKGEMRVRASAPHLKHWSRQICRVFLCCMPAIFLRGRFTVLSENWKPPKPRLTARVRGGGAVCVCVGGGGEGGRRGRSTHMRLELNCFGRNKIVVHIHFKQEIFPEWNSNSLPFCQSVELFYFAQGKRTTMPKVCIYIYLLVLSNYMVRQIKPIACFDLSLVNKDFINQFTYIQLPSLQGG